MRSCKRASLNISPSPNTASSSSTMRSNSPPPTTNGVSAATPAPTRGCASSAALTGAASTTAAAAANLIRDAFLQARVLEHLALAEHRLVFVNDALELAAAHHERRVRCNARTDARLRFIRSTDRRSLDNGR